jgi:cysteine desulfuration protein SufE
MKLADLQSDFAVLDDWEDRYRYIIELGRTLPPMAPELKNETTKVRGCASQVWLVSEPQASGTMHFLGESDAHIVQGLIAILFTIYEGKSPREILSIDPGTVFDALGLKEHLTPQRSNGLASMVERIRADSRTQAALAG